MCLNSFIFEEPNNINKAEKEREKNTETEYSYKHKI